MRTDVPLGRHLPGLPLTDSYAFALHAVIYTVSVVLLRLPPMLYRLPCERDEGEAEPDLGQQWQSEESGVWCGQSFRPLLPTHSTEEF